MRVNVVSKSEVSSMIGYWKIHSNLVPEEVEIMHVGDDGRMIHEAVMTSDPLRKIPVRVWFEHVANDEFEIRHSPREKPWPIQLYTDDESLVIEHKSGRRFEFERMAPDEVPEAFQETLAKARQRMDAEEAKAAQSDDAG